MSTVWAEVSCRVPCAMVDQLADFLVTLSGTGVSIDNLSLDTFSLDTLEETPIKTVTAYFPTGPDLEEKVAEISAYLAANGPAFPGFVLREPQIAYLKEEDWANNWKAHFTPSRIGARLVIKPTWEEFASREGDIIIQIDPGMAFGTGTHPTTKLCLETLEEIFFREGVFGGSPHITPDDLLDVGTGTGILAIAAARMGASRVVAVDIDPQAVAIARENLLLNEVAGEILFSTNPLEDIPGDFAVVVANILAEELARLSPHLTARLRPGGYLILSGILTEREEIVLAAFAGLTPVDTRREGEWSCLTLQRKP